MHAIPQFSFAKMKSTTFLMKTAAPEIRKRLQCKILTVAIITDMDLRRKSKSVPILCQFFLKSRNKCDMIDWMYEGGIV